jgi:hypothetical protein
VLAYDKHIPRGALVVMPTQHSLRLLKVSIQQDEPVSIKEKVVLGSGGVIEAVLVLRKLHVSAE